MKIASFNINNINRRLPNLLAWLRRPKPDIVALQELKAADGEFPAAALRKAGYGAVWRGQKTWNGVAILAKGAEPVLTRDPARRSRRQPEPLYRGRRRRAARHLDLPAQRQSPAGAEIRLQARLVRSPDRPCRRAEGGEDPVVLAGDYNVAPTPLDIYPTKSWDKDALIQPESRAAFRRLTEQGWVDAIRKLHPKEPMYSFWDYKRQRWPRDAGLRLDHLLLSRSLARRLESAGVDREVRGEEGASDHAPAWIVLS